MASCEMQEIGVIASSRCRRLVVRSGVLKSICSKDLGAESLGPIRSHLNHGYGESWIFVPSLCSETRYHRTYIKYESAPAPIGGRRIFKKRIRKRRLLPGTWSPSAAGKNGWRRTAKTRQGVIGRVMRRVMRRVIGREKRVALRRTISQVRSDGHASGGADD